MKRSKRILAVLLTAVLTLVILAGCGSKPGTYTFSAVTKSSVASMLQKAGLSASPDEKALDTISASYASQISISPMAYDANTDGSRLNSLQSKWSNDCINALTTGSKKSLCVSIPCPGNTDEAAVAAYCADRLSSIVPQFNEFVGDTAGTTYYYIYPFHAVSGNDPENSVWVMLTLLYVA